MKLAAPGGGSAAEIVSDNDPYQTRMALGCFLSTTVAILRNGGIGQWLY